MPPKTRKGRIYPPIENNSEPKTGPNSNIIIPTNCDPPETNSDIPIRFST